MARRMVGDDQDVFRVVVIRRQSRENPDFQPGVYDPENNPRMVWDGEEYTSAYGPYNTIGSARARATSHRAYCGEPRPGVVSVEIQKAETVWEPVE